MAVLTNAHQLTKSFGARPLFRDLTFSVASGERIGLIGPNGAGKSTLLRIIAGQESPDSGTLSLQKGLRVGFLAQVPYFREGATILATLLEGAPQPDAWECLGDAREYLSRLRLDTFGAESLVATLSGGWRKRLALGRELMRKPDLLLLDEPTNHLDLESIVWLETFLARAPFATLTITHDRLFLQRISNRILELDPRHAGGLLAVEGDYARFLEVRGQLITAQERREVILKNTLRRETEWLRQGAKARTTKQQARIHRAGELKDEVEDLTARNLQRSARIDFQGSGKAPKKLLDAKGISKAYGTRLLFPKLDVRLGPGTRLGLLGVNGSGKSTLIRVLLGTDRPDSGTVERSEHLTVAYFDQGREALDPELTVARTLCPSGDHVEYRGAPVHIRGYLDRFLFTSGQLDMAVGRLSGGEQSRLLIARLMLRPANLLVLDEPTNDLDLATLNVLEDCLADFPGAVILVTHDRYFLDQVVTQILAFPPEPGPLVSFASLAQWEASPLSRPGPRQTPRPRTEAPAVAPKAASTAKKRLGFNEQRELDSMEATLHAAEERLAVAARECSDPANASNANVLARATAEMAKAQAEVDRLYARWAELDR